jgi:DNA-binding NarL/FixJ family response regulator
MNPAAAPSTAPIRVLLVDDHKALLWGLSRLIESSQPPMTVVGEAGSRTELLALAEAQHPDVILLDLDLAGHDASEDLHLIRAVCNAQVLVLTGNTDPLAHQTALMRGARGVVEKSQPAQVILRAIERVHAGEVWANRDMVGKLLGALVTGGTTRDPVQQRIATLTAREREIVGVLAGNAGVKGSAIADMLAMSESTLRNHLTAIYEKLQVRNRVELILFANEHGLATAPKAPQR